MTKVTTMNIKKETLFLACFIFLFVILVSCQQELTCNKPYMKMGNACCLDKNHNTICDYDDLQGIGYSSTYGAADCESPSIKVGQRCCVDDNKDSICDEDLTILNDVTCNKPYIKQYNDCCLDKNDNAICDIDEQQVITCNKPYLKVGNGCCLDKDTNGICDYDEQPNLCPKPYISADSYGSCCLDKNNNGACDNTELK